MTGLHRFRSGLHVVNYLRAGDRGLILAQSDERDVWMRRLEAAERAGFERGRQAGVAEGASLAERELAADWHAVTHPVAYPQQAAAEGAMRRLARAESLARIDAAEWESTFVAVAHNTAPQDRTPEQRAVRRLYP